MISLRVFFHFLKILIFWANNGVKEQKWPKIGKKLNRTLSEEEYVMIVIFSMFVIFSIFSMF